MAINDVYEVKFVCTLQTQVGIIVRHFMVTAESAPIPDQQAVGDAVSARFGGNFRSIIALGARYEGVIIRRLLPGPATASLTSNSGAGASTDPSAPQAKQVSGLITLRTPLGGRKNRGRAYIPFPSVASNTSGVVPSAGYITLATVIAGDFRGPIVLNAGGSGNLTLVGVIWHRATSTVTQITSYIVRTKWATQRRRGDFGEPNPNPI